MIYITYRDLKVKDSKMTNLLFQVQIRDANYQLWNLTPFMMMHLTYHDLKLKLSK